jgi:hypothetical protein
VAQPHMIVYMLVVSMLLTAILSIYNSFAKRNVAGGWLCAPKLLFYDAF